MIPFVDFLSRIIDDGIEAATRDYREGPKLEGAVAGFKACRGKTIEQLEVLLVTSRQDQREAYRRAHEENTPKLDADYWYWRCRESEIEWVCNVVSAALLNEGAPVIIQPTARGVGKAAEILGVGEV